MEDTQHFAKFRFGVPDFSVPPEDRSLFSFPATTKVVHERIELHDFRTSTEVTKGPEGLDVQGFTYINHRSVLHNSDQWFDSVRDAYIPEVEDLICKVTGAKRAIVNNVAFRRKLAADQEDPTFYYKRGHPLDQALSEIPKDVALVYGKTVDESLEPARAAHIDYTPKSLRDSARYCRKDIKAAAQMALDAEDANTTDVPRYAAYSVWRPLKTVQRDPLAACDWRTLDQKKEMIQVPYRAISDVNEDGEYMMEAWVMLPPNKPVQQKWYWMPDQKPDEVLIIKFADTAADGNPNIAGGSPHSSPEVEGTEDAEPRNSIECRVLAFW